MAISRGITWEVIAALPCADGPVDANHHQARFTWHLGPASGEPVVIGFDVVVLDGDGRIRSVHGFLDKVPAAA